MNAALPSQASESADALYASPVVRQLREDLALALRAAAHHRLEEGVCNHFSVMLPGREDLYLINPRGLHWCEVGPDDIVLIDVRGKVVAGRHRVEPTALFIHGAVHRLTQRAVVLHCHMPYATALTLTGDVALDPTLSQNAMRYMGRIAIDATYNGLALDDAEGERIARTMMGENANKDVAFLANHGVIVTGHTIAHAYDDLYYLERACLHQVLAQSTGRPLKPVDAKLAAHVAAQIQGEREQSDLFFEALRRLLPAPAGR
ncbi:aldolase [Xenophilus sp. Marseille-Q4582]|uniref:aldolase n=1 Tax=Xenophilus sp. Marseille-Q4582 TaxID=2866600 RepID=UPI001CE4B15A|nr:aldolase [Xenophilus sp. Marseille-Q4582]